MTEAEAANKRCCGPEGCGRLHGQTYVAQTTGGYARSGGERFCIGSACMAWRADPKKPDDGFCGLAGVVVVRWP